MGTIDYDRSCANVDSLAKLDAARNVHTRRQGGIVPHSHVVANSTIQVDLYVLAQDDVSSQDITCTDHCTKANFNPPGELNSWMDDGFIAKTSNGDLLHQPLAGFWRAYTSDNSGFGIALLCRFQANDRDAIQPAFEVILKTADRVYPIEQEDIARAKDIVLGYPSLSARDALHIAVMERHGISTILTFDRGYSAYPGITVLDR